MPLFLRWKRMGPPKGLVSLLSRGAGLLAPSPLIAALEAALRPGWPGNYTLIDDWACFSIDIAFFVLGYLIAYAEGLLERAERLRYAALALGAGAFFARLACGRLMPSPWGYNPGTILAEFFRGAASWGFAVAALGFGRRHMGEGRFFACPAYRLAREISFPLYFFHFAAVTAATYLLLDSGLSVPSRWAISTAAAWASAWILTELIRPVGPLRRLFGIGARGAREGREGRG